MLAAARILLSVVVGYACAALQLAPAHVVHLRNGIVQAKFFVLLDRLSIESQLLNIVVIEWSLARLVSTHNLVYLSVFHMRVDHVSDALLTEKVGAPRQKKEFVAKEIPRTNLKVMLLIIKFAFKSLIAKFHCGLELGIGLVLEVDVAFRVRKR